LEGPNTEGDGFPTVVPAHVGARIRGDVDDPFAPCPECGQKKRKPRTEGTRDATPKERSRVRIDIPVAERAHGYDDFMAMLGQAKERLGPELGYDEDTPNWYVLFAVLRDWLDTEPKTSGLRQTWTGPDVDRSAGEAA
jgi:hypothetical protein